MLVTPTATTTAAPAEYQLHQHTISFICFVGLLCFSSLAFVAGKQSKNHFSLGTETWFSLGISYFATHMGARVLYAAPELGYRFGWSGVMGYAIGTCLPTAVLYWVGPQVSASMKEGYCLTDWIKVRYGSTMQRYISMISLGYMFTELCAQFTSVGIVMYVFSGMHKHKVIIPVSIVTAVYAVLGGMPATLWTDHLQGLLIILMFVVVFGVSLHPETVSTEDWGNVKHDNPSGFRTAIMIPVALLHSELLNMVQWQRVLAAKNTHHLKKSLLLSTGMSIAFMVVFGYAGMIARTQDELPENAPHVTLFTVLGDDKPSFFVALVAILALCLVASSVDSLQNAILSLFALDIMKGNKSEGRRIFLSLTIIITANIPAILIGSKVHPAFAIMNFYVIGDMVAATAAWPVFLGLWPSISCRGAMCGCLAGFLTIPVVGLIGYGGSEHGVPWSCGVCKIWLEAFNGNWVTGGIHLILFAIVGPMSVAATVGGSFLEQWVLKDSKPTIEDRCINGADVGCTLA